MHQPTIVFLLGLPGAGKGEQARRLAERGYFHWDSGDALREEVRRATERGRAIKAYQENGDLVPEDIYLPFVRMQTREFPWNEKAVVLTGFPRTIEQVQCVIRAANVYHDTHRPTVITVMLNVSEHVAFNRCADRADKREDDEPAIIAERIEEESKRIPVIRTALEEYGPAHFVDGDQEADAVHRDILAILEPGRIQEATA